MSFMLWLFYARHAKVILEGKCNFSMRLKRSLLICTINLDIMFETRIVKDYCFCIFLKAAQALNNFDG